MGWLCLLGLIVFLATVFPALLIGGVALGFGVLYWLLPIVAVIAVAWMVKDAWNTYRAYRH
jgi:hypothetical protein